MHVSLLVSAPCTFGLTLVSHQCWLHVDVHAGALDLYAKLLQTYAQL